MKVNVTRKRDSQWFRGVTSLTIIKRGRLFPHVGVDMKFGEGASTGYSDSNLDEGYVGQITWKIDHKENPGMGMDFCEKVEISEAVQSLESSTNLGVKE